jgi:hypothetical protein
MIKEEDKKEIDYDFNYNLLKGKIAERLIEQLFIDLGYDIFPYGIETHIPNYQKFFNNLSAKNARILKPLRIFPDFVVASNDGKQTFLIDVKYRKNGTILLKNFKDYNIENVLFIIITYDSISYINSNEIIEALKDKNSTKITNFKSLEHSKLFNFNKDQKRVIRQVLKLCDHLLNNLLNNSEVLAEVNGVEEPNGSYGNK